MGIADQARRMHLFARRRAIAATLAPLRAKAERRPDEPGVTIAWANYNSADKIPVLLAAIRKYTSVPHDIIVVDNDTTAESLIRLTDVRAYHLPFNIGHGPALDLAMVRARTETVVFLDADAFPISHDWLDAVLEPLAAGAKIAGGHHNRAFVHPSFLAIRRQTYLRNNLSFAPVGQAAEPGQDSRRGLFMDVGEAASHILAVRHGSRSIHKIPPTSFRGPGTLGTVYGEVVYHNFWSTHGDAERSRLAAEAWNEAVEKYIPDAHSSDPALGRSLE